MQEPIVNKVGPFPDLDAMPPKDYEVFDVERVIQAKNRWLWLLTSRRCPYKCTY